MARPHDDHVPRFLRFAQALAFTSGVGTALAGCYASHEVAAAGDGGPRTDAPSVTDARSDRDAGRDAPVTCATCTCSWGGVDAGAPGCEALGLWECCAAVGPCAPPDLPA